MDVFSKTKFSISHLVLPLPMFRSRFFFSTTINIFLRQRCCFPSLSLSLVFFCFLFTYILYLIKNSLITLHHFSCCCLLYLLVSFFFFSLPSTVPFSRRRFSRMPLRMSQTCPYFSLPSLRKPSTLSFSLFLFLFFSFCLSFSLYNIKPRAQSVPCPSSLALLSFPPWKTDFLFPIFRILIPFRDPHSESGETVVKYRERTIPHPLLFIHLFSLSLILSLTGHTFELSIILLVAF